MYGRNHRGAVPIQVKRKYRAIESFLVLSQCERGRQALNNSSI